METTTIVVLIEKYQNLIKNREDGVSKMRQMLRMAKEDESIDVEDLMLEIEASEHDAFLFRKFIEDLEKLW